MNKTILTFCNVMLSVLYSTAQTTNYLTREAHIDFISNAPLEIVQATNNQAVSKLDINTGTIDVTVLMTAFEFEKALMQEHFNENYVESDKYPKSEFSGTIANYKELKWKTDGDYPVTVTGKFTLHGITKDITTKGNININGGIITATSDFFILLSDYNISIPAVVKDKLNNEVKINVTASYTPSEN